MSSNMSSNTGCNKEPSKGSNTGSGSRSPPSKGFYNIFPTSDANLNDTELFVKTTVNNEDLRPWTDVQGHLISWTVQVDQGQVSLLASYPGIKSISKLDLPAGNPEPQGATASYGATTETQTKRNEEKSEWIIIPTDDADAALCDQITGLLRALSNTDPLKYSFSLGEETLTFWGAHLTSAQRDEVAKHPGVKGVDPNAPIESTSISSPALVHPRTIVENRDVSYAVQKDAVEELVSISQPSTVPDIGKLKNYVFESINGARSYLYHFEFGVAFRDLAAEFPHVSTEHVTTISSRQRGLRPDQDISIPPFHSTCTAGKGLGQLYGASKAATLVVVRLSEYTLLEMMSALAEVISDIRSHPERAKLSVVSMSLEGPKFDPNNVAMGFLAGVVGRLLSMDVPVVVSAGNHANEAGRERIDTVPAAFAGDTFPLIVVGSCNRAGFRSGFSQTGPQLTTYALGEDVTCLTVGGDQPSRGRSGTSYSTPLVAGEIANLLSRETVPFDTSNGNLVKSLRAYLMTNTDSGWSRQPGIRVLWNGVTEAHNSPEPVADAPAPPDPPVTVTKKCAHLADNKYTARESLRSIIEDLFCPDAVAQGGLDKDSSSIMRRYHQGTLEDVSIAINYKPGLNVKLVKDDCVHYLLSELTDGCDGNDPEGNPANYKAGGEVTVGPVAYLIQPQALRQPARLGIQAKCDSSWKAVFNEYVLWGHGFASDDSGARLKRELEGCALLPKTWSFQYGLGSDGREWTAKFRTGVFQKKCVGHASVTAGAPGGFGCGGSGS